MLPGKTYTPEDFLRIAWRRKWLLAGPFALGCAVAAALAFTLPDRYRAETVILVVPQRVPESYVRSTVTMRIEDRLQSISQQILSRTRLERIIQDFSLYADDREAMLMEDIVARMRGNIAVEVVKGDAFRVSYIGDQPRTVMQVTDRLASLFIEENLRDREQLAEGTNQFLESQLELARQRLVEQEQKLAAYQRQYSGELPSQSSANLQVLQSLRTEMQSLMESLNRDSDRKAAAERALADLRIPDAAPIAAGATPSASAAPAASKTAQELAAARENLRALELRLTPEHPDVVWLRRTITELQQKVDAEALRVPLSPSDPPPPTTNPVELARRNRIDELQTELQNLDRQMAAKEAEHQRLRQLAEDYQARVEAVPLRQAEMAELTRDYGTLQNLYNNLLAKKEDSRIAANLERRQVGEHFKLLDPARLPEQPFSPNRLRIVLMGAAAGLGLGLLFAGLLEYRDTTFRTDQDVASVLALPVLARIPVMLGAAERQHRRRLRIGLAMTCGLTVILAAAAAAAWRDGMLDRFLR